MVGTRGCLVFASKEALENLTLKLPSESWALSECLLDEANVESGASHDTVAEELG